MANRKFGHKPIETFIEFEEQDNSPRKTQLWHVVNTMHGERAFCGLIRWHGPWRKYVFDSDGGGYFDVDFMRYVSDFIEQQMLKRRLDK